MATICMGCMRMKRSSPVCEHCGYDERGQNSTHQLPVGTIVGRQYTLGRVLGQGGFGITYIAWDNLHQQRVAVKEFFPSGYAGRDSHTRMVTSYDRTGRQAYENNKQRFLREAAALSRLQNVPNIVRILRCFEENGTAYIAMEYVEGQDLHKYLKNRRQALTMEETLSVLGPVITALSQVHRAGLVHRDISPDNIMLLPDGSAKLLDFGAARYVENPDAIRDRDTSTQAILKHGFAPPEQYRTHGSLGPWTDVYAMCATIYYCLTGKILPEAMARTLDHEKIDWSPLRNLPTRQRAALEKGLELQAKDRFASMEELWQQLQVRKGKAKHRKGDKLLVMTAAAAAAVLVAAIGFGLLPQNAGQEVPREPEAAVRSTEETTAPAEIQTSPAGPEVSSGGWNPVPSTASVNVKFTYKEYDTGITITGFENQGNDIPEHLVIPSEIEGKPVTAIGFAAFDGTSALTDVTIPKGVTSIGALAFWDCGNLKNVNIPKTVTRIGSGAFVDTPWFDSLTEEFVICGDGVLLKYNGTDTRIVIPSTVKMISSAFAESTTLTSVSIPDSVTVIGDAAFYGCTALTSVSIPDSVTIIDNDAFKGCKSLTSVSIPGSVTHIGNYAFYGCSKLENVELSNGVTQILQFAFQYCDSLRSITFPKSIELIGTCAFANCYNLEQAVFSNTPILFLSDAFKDCNLKTVTVSEDCIWCHLKIAGGGTPDMVFDDTCVVKYY